MENKDALLRLLGDRGRVDSTLMLLPALYPSCVLCAPCGTFPFFSKSTGLQHRVVCYL
ncbi:hypothetical protein PROFUN_00514 [Planoprotostelium fungivorum]|uniref:Uncharacterized protein n=1 Tax=Planoprotostelium fungivorum TaxID=1890364 RepID=A0A2P6N129_9EUKA|nr:hypothetical protein PROFUN_00514 [Planoprotostelium fungivorum]